MKPLPKKRVVLPWHRWKAQDLESARFDAEAAGRQAGNARLLERASPEFRELYEQRARNLARWDAALRPQLLQAAGERVDREGHRQVHAQLARHALSCAPIDNGYVRPAGFA